MTKERAGEVEEGDIVQIDPEHDPRFGACLLVVTLVKPWGFQGYVLNADAPSAGAAYYRVPYEKVEWCGRAVWMRSNEAAEKEESE